MKTGKSLEKLIFELEKALSANENVQIESPKKYRDKVTGQLREYDVVLTIKEKHHEATIAIECRDRSRPITVNQVEGFYSKLQHTGIKQGIIVSSKGFYKTARKKAEFLGIRCFDIEQVDKFPWILTSGIQIFGISIEHIDWMLIPQQDFEGKPFDFCIVDSNGDEVKVETLNANLAHRFNDLIPPPTKAGFNRVRISINGDKLFIQEKLTRLIFPLKQLHAKVDYTVTSTIKPFDLIKYSDKDSGIHITDVAIAELELGNVFAKLIIVYQEDEGGKVLFVRDENVKKDKRQKIKPSHDKGD